MPENNTLAEAITNTFLSMIENMHTCLPGVVVDYDFEFSRASVKPLIKKPFIDGDVLVLPVLKDIPVVFPRSSKAGMTFPLNKGDKVLIVFSQRSLDTWKDFGKDSVPRDFRKFDLSDAICIPGMFSFNKSDKNIASNNSDLEIQNEGQTITIKKNGDIEIGGSSLLKLVNENFKSLFNGHAHITTTPTNPTSTPVVFATPLVPAVITDNELTDKVKAQ